MKIEIWSDVICPWCYIGKRRFEMALASFAQRDDVQVIWRSFELDPNAPRQHLHQRARPLARRLRIQFKAAPDHLHVIPSRKIGKRRFKAPLADVAPGADHVRPDFDFHVRCLRLK